MKLRAQTPTLTKQRVRHPQVQTPRKSDPSSVQNPPKAGAPGTRQDRPPVRSSKHESWSVVEDRIDGWWNQRSAAGFKMRALVGQKKRFLVSKRKTDRTKRSRRSDGEVSLDNADAVIEGAPCFAKQSVGSCKCRSPNPT